jgi:hypothetical protein
VLRTPVTLSRLFRDKTQANTIMADSSFLKLQVINRGPENKSNNSNKFLQDRRVWKMGLANIRRIIHQNAVTLWMKQTWYQQNLILFCNSIRKPINQKAMWNALSIRFINDMHISLVKRTRSVVVSVLTVTSVLLHSRFLWQAAPPATAMRHQQQSDSTPTSELLHSRFLWQAAPPTTATRTVG